MKIAGLGKVSDVKLVFDLCGLASDQAPVHLGVASKIDAPR